MSDVDDAFPEVVAAGERCGKSRKLSWKTESKNPEVTVVKKIAILSVLVFVFFVSACAFADVLPKTTSATRDIVLVEEDEDPKDAKGGEDAAAKLNVEEMSKADFAVGLSSVRSADGDVYSIGDKLVLTFKSNQDCYLSILDFTPSGKILVLFPNKWVQNAQVKAGQVVRIPAEGQKFSMKVGGPAGVDVIKAIATNQETQILDPENQQLMGPFSVLKDVRVATRDILLVEEEDGKTDEKKQPLKWAAASLAVLTKADDPKKGGFGVAKKGDWVVKCWTDRDFFLLGEALFVKLQSNRPATVVSLTNKGASGKENALLPEGSSPQVKPGAITILPGQGDKWKLIAASKPGEDTVVAKLKDDKGEEIEVSFIVTIQE